MTNCYDASPQQQGCTIGLEGKPQEFGICSARLKGVQLSCDGKSQELQVEEDRKIIT